MTTPWAWRRRSRRLARRLPPDSAGAVLGDLHEEYGARLARDGRARAEWWLARQMWSLSRAYARYEHTRRSLWSSARVLRPGELTQTLRSLARSPWYLATAIAVIALGTALGTVIFAIVDGTLFKPLPYPDSSRLFAVSLGYSRLPEPFRPDVPVSPVTVAEWRAGAPDITFTAFYTGGLEPVGRQESVRNADVDERFFDVVGVRPLIGGFSSGDFDARTTIRPAIVTTTFWRERFSSAAEAMGQTLTDETGAGVRIVGVMPDTFLFPSVNGAKFTPRLLTPLVRNTTSRGSSLRVLVRLAPNADLRSAAERINAIVAAQAAARPPQNLPADFPPRLRILREGLDRGGLMSIDEALRSSASTRAWVVFGAATALVLLACFNVTGLAIARGHERRSDLMIRRALGASTRDLVRLLAIESVLIVAAGAAAGLLIAWWALPIGARLFAGDFMLILKPAVIDVRVAAFSAVVAIAGSLIVILLSARAVTRAGIRQSLAESTGTTRRVARRLSMISFETAVAYLVTITATLVVGSLVRAWNEDTGFDVRNAAILRVLAPRGSTSDDIDRLIADVRKIPGVQAAGGVAHALFENAFNGSVFDSPPGVPPAERPGPGGEMSFPIESVPVTSGFFPAAGLRPRNGRLPTDDEYRRGAPLVVVTETVARHYWPGQRAVGQVLINEGRPFDVIGVVNDTRLLSLDLPAQGEIFWPIAAMPQPRLSNVVIKFAADTSTNIDAVAASVRERCHDCWIFGALTLEDAMGESIRPRRFSAWLFSGFGLSALLIVGTGVLGVMAMTTTGRVREIGIRMALGATARGVVSQLLREQIASVMLGIVAGGLAAAWATKLLTSYLYKTEPTDAIAWAAAATAILLVAFAGAFVPARRASRIDPVKALRED
ncbi:MAG TPA: ABC transporter permease [Vicinamibacterales bacterium]|nr:ABC transporter permease [Vicinamibacterales bacterium]